jgi:hypothetical protein
MVIITLHLSRFVELLPALCLPVVTETGDPVLVVQIARRRGHQREPKQSATQP